MVEELASPDGSQRGVRLIVDDVVRADGWERGARHAESTALQLDHVLLEDDLIASRNVAAQAVLVKPIPDVLLDLIDRVTKLLGNGLKEGAFRKGD